MANNRRGPKARSTKSVTSPKTDKQRAVPNSPATSIASTASISSMVSRMYFFKTYLHISLLTESIYSYLLFQN